MNKQNKIILLNRFFYPDHSATSQILSDLAFYLTKQGFSVSVICSIKRYDGNNEALKKRENINDVDIYRVLTSNFGRNWLPGRVIDYLSYFLGMSIILFRITKKNDVVIAKTDPPLTSVLTRWISKLKQANHICWIQDLFPEVVVALNNKAIPSFMVKILKSLRNWSMRTSNANVVIGQKMKEKLLQENIPQHLLHILSNWSDSKVVYPVEKESNKFRKEWKLENKFIVGYSGNMGRVHEFSTIINAAKKLEKYDDVIFIFIGGGPQKHFIESEIEHLNIKNIHFKPYQDYEELNSSLSLPDVHLISLNPAIEGLCVPSKFYGVMAAGRPVIYIGDKSGDISANLLEDRTGLSIEISDVDGLVNAIIHFFENEKELISMGLNARQSLEAKYDKKIILKKWENLISRMP